MAKIGPKAPTLSFSIIYGLNFGQNPASDCARVT